MKLRFELEADGYNEIVTDGTKALATLLDSSPAAVLKVKQLFDLLDALKLKIKPETFVEAFAEIPAESEKTVTSTDNIEDCATDKKED